MSFDLRNKPAPACLAHFKATCEAGEPVQPIRLKQSDMSSEDSLLKRFLIVGGTLKGFRKNSQDQKFDFEDDGSGVGYQLSYADTDYYAHVTRRLAQIGQNVSDTPEVLVSNLAFNGSAFKHVEEGTSADCIVLANLFCDEARLKHKSPRKRQDPDNFNGHKWREVADAANTDFLIVVRGKETFANRHAQRIPDALQQDGCFQKVDESRFSRVSFTGTELQLSAEIFVPA